MPITEQTLRFLAENRLRDSRDWFHEHREEYQQHVLQPMTELVELLAPTMRSIDPELVLEPRVDRTISRIYRDTRFSHDKRLYREVMWCVFARDKKLYNCPPGFVLEFSPDRFRYGCGYYSAPPQAMQAMRELILADDPAFRRAAAVYAGQELFELQGDRYKRSRHADRPAALRDWLDRRSIAFMHDSTDFSLLFSPDLRHTLEEGFRLLQPIYEFLLRVQSMSAAQDAL